MNHTGDFQERPRVLFVNRSYWPDAEATGQLLTELCEDLSGRFAVSVVTGQPNQNPEGTAFVAAGSEQRNGVTIHRVRHSRFRKANPLGRIVNMVSFLIAATFRAASLEKHDIVVVETDPPLLCLLGAFLQRARGSRLVVYLQDLYPDVATAIGRLRPGVLAWALRRTFLAIYRRADCVVVLSSDMARQLQDWGVPAEKITCLRNWVDTSRIFPVKENNPFRQAHGLDGSFVVMYSGNLGLTQPLEIVLKAADRLRDRRDIVFLLVGDGASREHLERMVRKMELPNVTLLRYQPKAQLAASLSAADLHLVMLDPRVKRCLMPSKTYGIMASATPLVAMADHDCELAKMIVSEEIGCVVPPDDPEALAERLIWAASHRGHLTAMGLRARQSVVAQFDRKIATACFGSLLSRVHGVPLCRHPTRVGRRRTQQHASQATGRL